MNDDVSGLCARRNRPLRRIQGAWTDYDHIACAGLFGLEVEHAEGSGAGDAGGSGWARRDDGNQAGSIQVIGVVVAMNEGDGLPVGAEQIALIIHTSQSDFGGVVANLQGNGGDVFGAVQDHWNCEVGSYGGAGRGWVQDDA